jgi:hypothetical protein
MPIFTRGTSQGKPAKRLDPSPSAIKAISSFAAATIAGAFAGTWLGLSKLSQRGLITTLAAVMLVAAAKLIAIA